MMRLQVIVVLGLFSFFTWGQPSWTPISPLNYCPQFKIEFTQTHDGEYLVRIPTPSGPKNINQTLENINDLSSLTDILLEESSEICSQGRTVLRIENNAVYFEDPENFQHPVCRQSINYSAPYLDLIREITDILQFNGNRCDQLMAYTELQTKIQELSSEELIHLEKPGNLFHRAIQLFTGKDTDKLINLYNTCGGKDFTDKFIANLILLEAKNSCIMPEPPGMMSFNDAKELAQDVAKEYNGLGLTKLNSKKDEITQKAVLAMTEKVLENQVGAILGEHVEDVPAFINGLSSVQELKSKNLNSDDMDYISYGFSVDATFEVAQKALPILTAGSFKNKLPPTWSDEKKEEFLNSELLPQAEHNYAACMSEHYDKTGYGSDLSSNQKVNKRIALKENYCAQYPEQCLGASCEETVNILAGNPDIADSQVVQGCVMNSLLQSIHPSLRESIRGQKDTFKDEFNLSDELVEKFTSKTWESLLYCANRQVFLANGTSTNRSMLEYPDPERPPILSDPAHLQKISTDEFENVLLNCAEVAEAGAAKEFYVMTLLNQEALAEAFPSNLDQVVDEVIGRAYDPCLYKQQYISKAQDPEQSLSGVRAMLCAPMVEIAAANKVIDKTLNDLFEESNLADDPQARLTLKEFENCSDAALESSINALGRSPSERQTPIRTDQEATDYLNNNNEFFGCVKTAITQTTSIVGGAAFDQTVEEMAGVVNNPAYITSLKGGALATARQCFESSLNEIPNWREFNRFNEEDGLKELEEICGAKALEHVLPKVLIRETGGQMAALVEEDVIRDFSQVGDVLAASAFQLRRMYNLDLPLGLKGDAIVEWSFAQAHNAHIAQEGKDTDSFVEEYTSLTLNNAIGVIHENIKTKVTELQRPDDFSDFMQALTPACLYKVYSKYEPQIASLIEDVAQMPKKTDKGSMLDKISQVIVDGLRYQKSLGRSAYLNKLRSVKRACENVDIYEDPLQLAQTDAFDFILKSQTQNTLIETFEGVAIDQCKESLTDVANLNRGLATLIQQACSARNPEEITRAFSSLMTHSSTIQNQQAQRTLSFVQNRHLDMLNLLERKLNNPVYIDSVIFDGNPSPALQTMYENFSNIMTEKPATMKNLNATIAGKLFNDRSKGSFANDFVRIQVVNGLGLAGYEQAYEEINIDAINDSLGWLDWVVDKKKVLRHSRAGLAKKWTPQGIEELMAWDKIAPAQREALIGSVYDNAVLASVNGTEANQAAIADAIGEHASKYDYPGNLGTFSKRVSDYISNYVKERKFSVLGSG